MVAIFSKKSVGSPYSFSSCPNFEAKNMLVFAYFLCEFFHATCTNPFGYSPLQAFTKYPVTVSDSADICNYAIVKLFYFTELFRLLSATALSGITSRSCYCLGNLILGYIALSNPFVATNTSNFLAHFRKSSVVFVFFSKVATLRVFFYLLMFIFSQLFCAFSFILDPLTLCQIFLPNWVINDILLIIPESSYSRISI